MGDLWFSVTIYIPCSAYVPRVFNFAKFREFGIVREIISANILRIYARPAGNSLIVGVAYILSSAFAKLFQRNFLKKLFAKILTHEI